jgi:hypothetical protein
MHIDIDIHLTIIDALVVGGGAHHYCRVGGQSPLPPLASTDIPWLGVERVS